MLIRYSIIPIVDFDHRKRVIDFLFAMGHDWVYSSDRYKLDFDIKLLITNGDRFLQFRSDRNVEALFRIIGRRHKLINLNFLRSNR